ncbi:UV DNA damage repair endonuclease UvsE [Cohnella thailandensis]|uniref:UV DNA damage repair endonuclease UvsE n=1 Tax=Cohnella thailandensis TaxID=557557 RepID=A0A841T0P5_9BACL|nr:UV DNA damage repair endonuclease UvsE [Cohnella thailandensis]MBB6637993.1 UV DNA damage repair endonuclease UvsE [Cohnella thailandensis]MBP1976868.1 UV DNA damage endonuclease [Cohnella thailandensis]
MIVRFGFVAMSTQLENASPSRTMTMASFAKLDDREAGLRRLERLAEENLHNTLRLLKHCRYMDVKVYRLTSKLIPLATHEALTDWSPYEKLAPAFAEVGNFAKEHGMRLSFHPDHFTVLSTPREEVLANSIKDLAHHVRQLELMGLDERALCNIHVGGSYGDKATAGRRFLANFGALPERIRERITLENDDKTFNSAETLAISEEAGAPMVLDIHHHEVNNSGETPESLWPRIRQTWRRFGPELAGEASLPPKIHVSSPKSASDPRGHADYVELGPLLSFLTAIAGETPALDVMIEAKKKDGALVKLMDDLREAEKAGGPVKVLNGGSAEIVGG